MLSARDSAVVATSARADGRFGHGVLADSGWALLAGSRIVRSASVGLAVSKGTVGVQGGVIGWNAVALHVQDGPRLREVAVLPPTLPSQEVLVTGDTRFIDNQVRVGTGVVPLPDPIP